MALDQLLADAFNTRLDIHPKRDVVESDEEHPSNPDAPFIVLPRAREPKTQLLKRIQLGIEDEIDKWVSVERPDYPSLLKVNFKPYKVGLLI